MRKLPLQIMVLIGGISFLLNWLWENLQAPLYAGYTNFGQHFSICAVAAVGDAVIVFLSYFLVALLRKNIQWIRNITKSDVLVVTVTGAAVATVIERWALQAGRWHYTSNMPLVPMFNVGLLPFLQMIILPFFTFYLTRLTIKR